MALEFCGIEVDFPYSQAYTPQRALMANAIRCYIQRSNALLESPTGTGKSLALLSSALAFQDSVVRNGTGFIPTPTATPTSLSETEGDSEKYGEKKKQIWYTSRTHSQLQQLVGELKKLNYNPNMAILASRKQCCIFPPVRKLDDVNGGCRKVHKKQRACPYGKNGSKVPAEFRKGGELQKFTMTDVIDYCTEKMRCPYLIMHEMIKSADIIFAPYPYVLDPKIRKIMKMELKDDILIIDEAHNVEQTCRDVAQLTLKALEVEASVNTSLMSPQEEILYPQLVQPLKNVNGFFSNIDRYLRDKRRATGNSNVEYIPEESTIGVLKSFNLDLASWPIFQNDINIILKIDNDNDNPDTMIRFPNELIVAVLEKISSTLEYMFSDNGIHIEDFKIVYKCNKRNEMEDEIVFYCMNSGVVFSSIAKQTHSVVLASGTLTPLDTFSAELGVDFKVKISTNHVIDPSQIIAYKIKKINNLPINGSYQTMSNDEKRKATFKALGDLFLELLPIIPGGVLFFLPSYNILASMIAYWKSQKIDEKIRGIKPLYAESQNVDTEKLFANYRNSIDCGEGGFMIGVCRGKLSEGVDFTDNQSRAVFAFGIPYPNSKAAEVSLKRKYNDTHPNGTSTSRIELSKGDAWYASQTFRSLFQAVGRCIRHSSDYGAVILIDERYENPKICSFPRWMDNSFRIVDNIGVVKEQLNAFYADMAIKFPISVKQQLISFDATFDLTCRDCARKVVMGTVFQSNDTDYISKRGFMKALNLDKPKMVLIIKDDARKKVLLDEEPSYYSDDEGIAYKPLRCTCGTLHGARIFAVSKNHQKHLESLWLFIDTLYAKQGGESSLLETILETPKVMGMNSNTGGQFTLNFLAQS